jgi:hypothetical protein
MRFWFSCEIDAEVADAWSSVWKPVEDRLNALCARRDYGTGVREIAIIPMILGPRFREGRPERRLFNWKEREADYRTEIDFERFKGGNAELRQRLLLKNVVEAVVDIKRKVKKDFDGAALISDILEEFRVTQDELDRL